MRRLTSSHLKEASLPLCGSTTRPIWALCAATHSRKRFRSLALARGDGDVGCQQLFDTVETLTKFFHRGRVRDSHVLWRTETAARNYCNASLIQNRKTKVVSRLHFAACDRLAEQLCDVRKDIERARGDNFELESRDRA